jgi:hypothetical protein
MCCVIDSEIVSQPLSWEMWAFLTSSCACGQENWSFGKCERLWEVVPWNKWELCLASASRWPNSACMDGRMVIEQVTKHLMRLVLHLSEGVWDCGITLLTKLISWHARARLWFPIWVHLWQSCPSHCHCSIIFGAFHFNVKLTDQPLNANETFDSREGDGANWAGMKTWDITFSTSTNVSPESFLTRRRSCRYWTFNYAPLIIRILGGIKYKKLD